MSGPVQLDSNGDRIGDYWLWSLKERSSAEYERWGRVEMTKKEKGDAVSLCKNYVQKTNWILCDLLHSLTFHN